MSSRLSVFSRPVITIRSLLILLLITGFFSCSTPGRKQIRQMRRLSRQDFRLNIRVQPVLTEAELETKVFSHLLTVREGGRFALVTWLTPENLFRLRLGYHCGFWEPRGDSDTLDLRYIETPYSRYPAWIVVQPESRTGCYTTSAYTGIPGLRRSPQGGK